MKQFSIGSKIQLQDKSEITITAIKEEVTFSKEENGQQVSQTLSGDDFRKLVSSDADPKPGLKFIDIDKAQCEILEVTETAISYKKTWGSDSWTTSMSIDDFYARQESKMINIE